MYSVVLPESFPTLPDNVVKIQQLFAQGEVNIGRLLELIEEDAMLCANILKLVNSPFYGLQKQVTSIRQAITLLGVTIIRGVIMATMLKKSFRLDLSAYATNIENLDKISLLRVKLLNRWLQGSAFDLQYLSSVAFLMECGRIVFANTLVQHNLSEEFSSLRKERGVREAEAEFFENDVYVMAARLFDAWMFEEHFVDILRNINAPRIQEESILYIISELIHLEGICTQESVAYALSLAEESSLDVDSLRKAIAYVMDEL